MARVKGSFNRTIHTPDNHIVSQYDLHITRRRLYEAKNRKDGEVVLPLTSMIDMFSMLVIFLLLNFSSTGEVFFINKKLRLPEAKHARPIGNRPLISISESKVFFDAKIVGQNPINLEETDIRKMPQLRQRLRQVKALQMRIRPNQAFKGEVNIQADVNTPIVYIKRLMNILISEGWTGIHFATRSPEQKEIDVLGSENLEEY